ncbi:FtsX-like permease family protein [Runella sp. CRIBMP]|uniref:ABC transporter permease n=1 Tax=Runella sp. CRIBMP TaxID=2683261 RepID=UPI001412FB15|nr:ABC transporter permease [Runella sp. CRIBMP]NBB19921.1 FtsX-like permease family protein [Runella sp. CRIBMP]
MLKNYLETTLRNLRAKRVYTTLNILGLSVGMASGLLIFLFISHHLSTDRHHQKFNRIYRIVTDLHLEDGSVEYYPEAPLPMARAFRADFPQIEQAAYLKMNRELTVSVLLPNQSAPKRFLELNTTALVESELFDILDYQWLKGNQKTALRKPNTVVITQSLAKKYFGTLDPLGRTINLDNLTEAKITGVLADPPKTTNTDIQLFISAATLPRLIPDFDVNDWWSLNSTDRVYLTLKNPLSAARLEAALPALSKKHFAENASVFQFHIQPLADVHFDVQRIGGSPTVRPSLLWSLGAVGLFLVLIACINFINLATAQALSRGKEIGIRKTLGSTKRQIRGQFLLETALIVLISAVFAVIFALICIPIFNQWLPNGPMFQFTPQAIGFLLLLVVLVTVLAGGYPAFVLSGFSPWAALKGPLVKSRKNLSLRKLLIMFQFGICQALLVGTLVVTHQVRYLQDSDLGFSKNNIVIINLPNPSKTALSAFKNDLRQSPYVQSISACYRPPAAAVMNGGSFKFGGKSTWETFPIRERLADSDYLSTFDLHLAAGRNITESDTIREYLVNEALLKKLNIKDSKQILGRKLETYLSPVALPIVGVVKDFHLRSLHETIQPCFIATQTARYKKVGVQIVGQHPEQTLRFIEQSWQKRYPNEVFTYEYLDEQLAKFYQTETLIFRVSVVFAGIAILISCLGLYGLVLFTMTQRTQEIGIRKVLGASVAGIISLLSKDFLKLVAAAIVVASPLAWYAMNQWLQDFAYHIQMEWWMIGLAGTLSIFITLLTVSFHSIKAALMNPVKSLKVK